MINIRKDIEEKALVLEQLEDLERLYVKITDNPDGLWKVTNISGYDDVYLITLDTLNSFVQWLESEIKILKIQIGE